MHLVFTSYDNINKFAVQKSNKTDEEMEFMFNEFASKSEYSEKMEKYIELLKREKEIARERSSLLKELKTDFKDKFLEEMEETHPEYFL